MPRTRGKRVNSSADSSSKGVSDPLYSLENRETRMISLAYDLAEQRLKDGTATSQEVVHFLRLGTEKDRLEREILKTKNELMTAQKEALESAKAMEELYSNALSAFATYRGASDEIHSE